MFEYKSKFGRKIGFEGEWESPGKFWTSCGKQLVIDGPAVYLTRSKNRWNSEEGWVQKQNDVNLGRIYLGTMVVY